MENSANGNMRVVLVDDHALVRAGLRSLLEKMPGVEVALETGDGRRVSKQLREVEADLLLLDIALPGLNGLDVASRVRREHPDLSIIMLSMYSNEEYVLQALRAGCATCLKAPGGSKEGDATCVATLPLLQRSTPVSSPMAPKLQQSFPICVALGVRPR